MNKVTSSGNALGLTAFVNPRARRRQARMVLFAAVLALPTSARAQISLSNTYSQNFDTLASSGTSSTVPLGWAFAETGSSANTTYAAGTGSGTAGDTYSFGPASSSERAFGGLQSGALVPIIGARFKNDTGASLQGFSLAYVGEQWRVGTLGRADKVTFEVSTNATSVSDGAATWWAGTALDFTAPITAGTVGALDGNASANRTLIKKNFTFNAAVASGSEFWIRWLDFNASGADDGLAVDDLTINSSRNLSWDGNGVTAPNPSNNDGVWSDATNWHDGTTNVTWANASVDNAIFGTGAGAGANTVTLNSNQIAGTVLFAASSPTYTLSGTGNLTVSGTAGINAANSANIAVAVKLGTDQTWTVASGATLDISGGVDANSKTLTKAGGGTLRLSGASGMVTNATSATVTQGVIELASGVDNRLPSGISLTLGDATNSANLILGDSTGKSDQTLAGIAVGATGSSNRVVGGNASSDSVLTLNLTSDQSFSGTIGGTTATENRVVLAKSGSGKLTLTAANTYTGGTSVVGGTLKIANASGSATGSGAVSISAAKLMGSGTISGAVTVTGANATTAIGVVDPGDGVGRLSTESDFTLSGYSRLSVEIKPVAGTPSEGVDNDVLTLQGGSTAAFSMSGSNTDLDILFVGSFNATHIGKTYRIVNATAAGKSVSFANVFANLVHDQGSVYKYIRGLVEADVTFTTQDISITLTAIPEPASLSLLTLAGGMILRRRRN